MARHQHGIFSEGTRSHHHLEFSVRSDATDQALTDALTAVRLAGADHRANGGTHLVVGFGPTLWQRLADADLGTELRGFPGFRSPDGRAEAPATQRDLWVWVHAAGPDATIDVVRAVVAALDPVATLELDLPGFVYLDSRDLTGFIDGTANPSLDDASSEVVIPAGPGEGGSMAMTMRFRHDLGAFDALEVADQERVVGRHKPDSAPLAELPDDAHIARAEVADDDGEELVVYRRSVPWATASEQGLHFVSFGADLDRFEHQLRRMFGLEDGITDRLLGFTEALTGSFWFCPGIDALEAIAPTPDDDED